MNHEEKTNIRYFLYLALISLGVVYGFFYHLNQTYKPIDREQKGKNNSFSYMGFYASKNNGGTRLRDSRIPIYKSGVLKTEILAKELVWSADQPVILKDITLHEFSDDGREVIATMSGDFGELKISETNEVESLKLWGNTKVKKFASSSEEINKPE